MPARTWRTALNFTTLMSLVAAPLALGASAASANVDTGIVPPYSQDWSNSALISAVNDWSGVAGVIGYRGDDLSTTVGANPQTVLADGSATPVNVIANNTASLNTNSTGGIVEHEPSQSIALQGSGTADVPHVVFRLDLSGKTSATVSYKAKDLDGSADNAVQSIATQYRVGNSGNYTDLPAGYVADATEANAATKVTDVSVTLPAAALGSAEVFVRVLTVNATGNDEWVGIDDINVTASGAPAPLVASDPGDKAVYVTKPLTEFTLAATGGAAPYTWAATGMPDGITVSSAGVVSGTPTATDRKSVV